MPASGAVATIGAGRDFEDGPVAEPGCHSDGIFRLAGIMIEFEGPVALQHLPNLVDGDSVTIVVWEGKEREVGDGNRRAEHFGTAVDRKKRGHGLVIFREEDCQDPSRDRRISRIF